MSVPLYLPTETEAGALAFAAGIDTGRIPCLREYLDEHLARENFAKYPGGISKLLGIFRVEHGVAVRVAEGSQQSPTGLRADDRPPMRRAITIHGDAAVIELTKGLSATIDAADVALVEGRNWHAAYPPSGKPYAASRGRKSLGEPSTLYLHVLLMGRRAGLEIDHADGDALNNRRSNLRWATRAQNQFNIGPKSNNPIGLKGISFDPRGGKWRARIRVAGRETFLGYFSDPEAAAEAYREAARRYHGEFGRTA